MKVQRLFAVCIVVLCFSVMATSLSGRGQNAGNGGNSSGATQGVDRGDGRRLFERETFGGNGRTCLTCHSRKTGTVSPADAQARFQADPHDPLFLHDGSDDGLGNGVSRILADATILMTIPLPPNVRLANSTDRFVTVRRGIPTTLNTPGLDPVLMLDGRQPTLELQGEGAILAHAEAPAFPALADLEAIKRFQKTEAFFSSPDLFRLSQGGPAPGLPLGNTDSERRGRRFFENVPPDPSAGFKPGLCAHCHSGTLLNQTNEFAPFFIGAPIPTGTRFVDILVSHFNLGSNPVQDFVFNAGTAHEVPVSSPDPGRALITGNLTDLDAFKISQLRGIRHTGPYFHDNSAKTLADVAAFYTRFFRFVTDGLGPGGAPLISLTAQDEADLVAFMKLLD